MTRILGGVETGGTWIVCAIGSAPDDILAHDRFPTADPPAALERIVAFFSRDDRLRPEAIGVGAFGPLQLDPDAPDWGSVMTTPKPGWSHTAIASELVGRLGVPVTIDTDVNAAAIAESRWGAGAGLDNLCYLTVGTGIGAGLLIDGRPVHGLVHPEVGHLRIPHDRVRDPFGGVCPAHGDCWEGLASGPAISQRWGRPAGELTDDHDAWKLEAEYLALGILAIVSVASPRRVIMGGGVMGRAGLRAQVGDRLVALNGGYLQTPLLADQVRDFLVAPRLGDKAGVLGALAMAAALPRV
jgi:fructokinase